ncbi:hypothetical protein [Psychroflexus sp. MES1-P1E]|uniref:hypothetical protein n=1 Tax=Psychroflexus sp. MES1-P1E TaxID=2058320 RepID=UPI000C798D48|nr:hypothetical protein [Psychroflexus sp. MES1-P1E]PKG41766.1 hypothetical protein CXF67_13930 [Psychroflexus sp. MES1-P1E]
MKKIFTLIFALIAFTSYSQTYKAVKITETTKLLHSGVNSLIGGVSRVALPINLPENTVEWYYSFSTTAGSSRSSTLNLAVQVAAYASTGPMGSTIAKGLKVPPGNGEVDVSLITSDSKSAFLSKNDDLVKRYSDLSEISTTQSVKTINNLLTGSYYLGLRNPSSYESVSVTIEVVAMVKVEATTNGWTATKKQEAYINFNQPFKNLFKGQLKQPEIDSFTGCFMSKITSNYTPYQLSAFAEYELNDILAKFGDKCSEELNINFDNVAVPQQNINKDNLIGKWKDQNSTFTIYENGTILLIFDNGKSLFGNWELTENKLKFVFDFGKTIDEYIIIELTDKIFKYKGTKEPTLWSADKIGNY